MHSAPPRCTRCVMPVTAGHIELDSRGVCNICRKHRPTAAAEATGGDAELRQRVAELKGAASSRYDCLVVLSGGKDSTMALYSAVRELGLRPLVVFIDNGFCNHAMVHNVTNATDRLGADLLIYRPQLIKRLFRHLLQCKSRVYYCRICNALIDVYIRRIALQHEIPLIIGGHTKGQEFLKGAEMFWIYQASDAALLEAIAGIPEFQLVADIFASLAMYLHTHFSQINFLSPFHYLEYGEAHILSVLTRELDYRLPDVSWPTGSTNCLFNFVTQLLTVRFYGYTQHEAEISALVRKGEMPRDRALEIIETPITRDQLDLALQRIGMTAAEID